jgi:hypothetical protein
MKMMLDNNALSFSPALRFVGIGARILRNKSLISRSPRVWRHRYLLEDISKIVHAFEVLDKLGTLREDGTSEPTSLSWALLTHVLSTYQLLISHSALFAY